MTASAHEGPRRADVVVVGDGPAGSALAAACAARGVDVVLAGDDRPWTNTYGVWVDEIDGAEALRGADVLFARLDSIVAYGADRHDLNRTYGVIDNDALRATLRVGVDHVVGMVESTKVGTAHHSVVFDDGRWVDCRLIVVATGRSVDPDAASGHAWQTAAGVVLHERPDGELGEPTLMDFRAVADRVPVEIPTFVYALPVADGWLVEETVLAARPAVDPGELGARLAGRLGRPWAEVLRGAARAESVEIPMGGPLPDRAQPIVLFGAAAGYIHPATGYSLATSLRAAPRVADAIVEAVGSNPAAVADPRGVWDAVWPAGARRARVLHDYGLERLLALDPASTREFFDRFFELPVDDWSGYLRGDGSAAEVSRVMTRLFRSADWPMRRRLASGNPLALARLLRP